MCPAATLMVTKAQALRANQNCPEELMNPSRGLGHAGNELSIPNSSTNAYSQECSPMAGHRQLLAPQSNGRGAGWEQRDR